jgi:hypothetical protein
MVLNKKNLLMVILLLLLMIIGGIFYLYFFIYSREEITSTPSSSTSPMLFPKPLNPTVNNAKADFVGTNIGDSIYFSWSPADRVKEYVRFRAYSVDGPWEEEGHIPGSLTNGVDITLEARQKTLCYRLEAQDDKGSVIKSYEPICIPKYEEE